MKTRTYILLCIFSVIVAAIYYAYNQQWIMVYVQFTPKKELHGQQTSKKKSNIIFWHQDSWKQEIVDIIWSDNATVTLTNIVNTWLSTLDEEHVMPRKVSLQSVALSATEHDVYLSFDRTPFGKEQSTFVKLMWVEGLLKTIRENNPKIQNVQLLVHHQPLQDMHLDFSKPWSIQGFL